MKQIEKWLNDNSFEYSRHQCGNSDYFGDGFSVPALFVPFYFDGIGNTHEKERQLVDYMRRKKAYICKAERFGAGYTYRIMSVFDAARLEEHEKRVSDAVETFWQADHARRPQATA